ncbi:hypothetical protein I6E61_00510 [Psychrobacter sp. NZS113]|uniref:hypothetical protein n=1 Tax=Psychrobacter sp. NZS113 TaxID=2792045 RepID=UPI0018CD869F|nr:hypothetical protein [Psychrobacter sp. NZS113]MBH0094869.1 hypothetical protein [Psychrobacter sp. NZS113]
MNSSYKKYDEKLIDLNLEVLGVRDKDIDSIVKETKNVTKMVFEQVFLVMLYTRQLMLHPKNGANVKARLKLIDIVFSVEDSSNRSEISKVRSDILQMMEANKGSNDVVLELLLLKDKTKTDAIDKILLSIQNAQIAFAPLDNIHGVEPDLKGSEKQYTYYEMYASLKYTMTIFQKFLNSPVYDKSTIKIALFEKIKLESNIKDFRDDHERWISEYSLSDEKKKILNLLRKEHYAELVKNYGNLDKKIFIQDLRADIAINLGAWAHDVFRYIHDDNYSSNILYGTKETNFFNIANNRNSSHVTITVDRAPLEDIYKLNQLEQLMDNIKIALKASFESKERTANENVGILAIPYVENKHETKINNEDALTILSEWYTENSIGLFRKVDQIPSTIVSIIDFDLYSPLSEVNKCLDDALRIQDAYNYNRQTKTQSKNLSKKSPIKNRNELITYIVSLYLCLGTYTYENFSRASKIVSKIENNERINLNKYEILGNTTMFSWSVFKLIGQPEWQNNRLYQKLDTNFDEDKQNKMMYLFKKIPISIRNNEGRRVKILSEDTTEDVLETLVNFITNQPSTKPYPYNSSFPLPLRIRKK